MKHVYYLLLSMSFLLGSRLESWAQDCPPPGFPDPGNTCQLAPILCENLDGYCSTINNNNVSQSFPGCPGWTLNNDEWFAFYAGTTQISIQITPSNCQPGQNNGEGLQGGIYRSCGPPWQGQAVDLQCSCTENPFILESNNFIVGQIYWIVMDGCGGSVCDYEVEVLSGSTVGAPPGAPGPINGPITVCQGQGVNYNIAQVPAATIYNWEMTPSLGTIGSTNNNATVTFTTPGTTQLCVDVANACYPNDTVSCIEVTVIPTPTATLSGGGIFCANGGDPVELTVTFTGDGPWEFIYRINGVAQPAIQTSDNPYTFTVTQPGTYTLQSVRTVVGNCPGTVSGSASVTQVTLAPTFTVTNADCGEDDGAINLTPAGGNAPYQFQWDNGATTEDLNNIPPGTYVVTVTDANGCTAVRNITVNDNIININITGTVVANTTCNGGNGSIDITVTPNGTYEYEWSPGGQTTPDINNLEPGTYTVTVSTGVTCTGTATFTVNDNPNEPNLTATTVQSTCDLENGSINLSVSGGVSPYTYEWSPGGQTTQDLSNIPAGTYTVTVTGANGCTNTLDVTVNNNNPPINITATVVNNTTCNGGNGSIDVSVSPAGTYTYEWSPGGQTTQDINNLPPGTYTVTVSAGGSCTATADFTIDDNPNEPQLNAQVTQTTCELSNGSINLNVTGGVTPYTYEWSPGGQSTQDLSNIPAGTYTVTVTGANGCSATLDVTVDNNNPPINITANVMNNTTCNGGNGSIDVSVSPAGNYTYSWNPGGQTTQDINNLPPGDYTITVTGAGSCSETATFTVNDDPNEPQLSATTVESTCDLNNGSINLTVNGGVTPYTYLWSPGGQTTQDISNIPAGTYSVTVTGANGCTAVTDITVDNNNPPITINANINPSTTCNGNGNGSIVVLVSPSGSYTYNWEHGPTTPNLNNLTPGLYTVTVSAGGTCVETATFEVPDDPNAPELSFSTIDATCDLSNGSINLTVQGGVTPYTYSWDPGGQTTQDINNLPPGLYLVTVTGANGCSTVDGVTIDNQQVTITVDGDVTPQTSCTVNNGRITLSYSPNNVTFLWSNNATTPNLNNVPTGLYTVTVSVGGSCFEVLTFEVPDDREYPVIGYNFENPRCNFPNGYIDIDPVGGVEPYTYKWSNNATSQDLMNLGAGNYSVTVTSALGCTAVEFFNLVQEQLDIQIYGTVSDNISCSAPNGFIDIDVEPTGINYTYKWSNNAMTQDLNNLPAGIYTVTVTWGNCTAVATYEVLEYVVSPNVSLAVTPATCGLSNGAINLTASGASPPYTFKWSNNATTEDLNNLPPGPYTVTVTDFFGCTSTASTTVGNNNIALNITGTTQANTSCAVPNGSVNITVTPAGTYNYSWSNSATSEDLTGLAPGPYSVTVTLGTSCSATAGFTVDNNTTDPVITAVVTPSICGNPDGAINLTITNGNAPYTFNWSNNASSEDLVNILAGLYSVTVTDATGCVADTTLDVVNNASTFSLSGIATALTSCSADNGGIDLTVTPAGTYTYQWSNSAVTQDISNLPAGTYTVSVTETGNCVASASFIVADNRTYPSLNVSVTPEVCDFLNGAVDLSISGGQSPFTFSWSNSSMTEDLSNIAAGNYSVIVTGNNGCADTTNATVPANYINFSLSANTQSDNSCVVDNGAIDLSVSPTDAYTFKWSNNATSEDLTGLPAGVYDVTVTLFGSCTATGNYTVTNTATAPLIAEVILPALCGQNSGSINLTVTSGATPYSFQWSNSALTEDINNVPAGNYSVIVTGANGCTATKSFTVIDDVIIPDVTGIVNPNTACVGNNGAINISVNPPLNYTFNWTGGLMTQNLNNIAPGSYTVTVNGGGSCITTAMFTVPNDASVITLDGTDTDILCFGSNNGAIDLTVNGGTTPYTFNWSPSVPGNPEDPANLAPGAYTVTVTDPLGCSATRSFTITQPSSAVAVNCSQSSSISQPGATDGEAAVNISGGTAPYQVVWSPGGSQTNVPAGLFPITSLAEGSYAVTVTDANGCVVNCGFTIALIPCETTIGSMGSTALSLCGDGCITASYNQTGQFLDPNDVLQFVLHEGAGNQIVNEIARSSTPTFCFNPASMSYGTTYYVSAVAGNNNGSGSVLLSHYCTVVSIGTPIAFYEKPVAAIAQPGKLSCAVEQLVLNGSADLPGSSYNWSTSGTGQIVGNPAQEDVTVNAAGTYTLIVTTGFCKDTAVTVVQDLTNQPVAAVTASPDDILDCKINEIILAGTIEGTLNANAIWLSNGQVYANGITLTIDQPGTYEFVILDTLSFCTDTAVITINEDQAYPPLFVNPPGFLNCFSPVTTLSGGSPIGGVQFRWATVSGTDTTIIGSGTTLSVNAAGTYYLIGFDPVNGCTNALDVSVAADFNYPTADAGTGFTIDCFGETAYLDGSGSTGPANLQYQWTTSNGLIAAGSNTPQPEINLPGTYTLKVTDPVNGCSDTDQVLISPNEPQAQVQVSDPPCEGRRGSIIIDTVIGGLPPIQYSFDNGSTFTTQSAFLNLNPGTYNVLVVDAVGCSTTFQAVINPAEPFEITLDAQVLLELGDSIQLNAQVNVPDDRIGTVSWTPPTGLSCDTCLNPVAKPLTSTLYRVVVTTVEGCEDRAPVLLIVDKRADIYVPNIFSPNGDGDNDIFTIYADPKSVLRIQTFQVFSRWGELVHEYYNFAPNNPAAGWDGRFNSQELNPGVFVWYALVEFIDGRVVLYEGDVTIKR